MSETSTETATDITKPPWVSHYLVVLPNATGAAILMLPTAEGWRLPQVRAEGIWLSAAAKLIPLLRSTLGLDFEFTIPRYVAGEVHEEERWDRHLLVLEPKQPLDHPPVGGQWVNRAMLQEIELTSPDQRAPLLRYLEENEQGKDSALIDYRRSPWARLGWFAEASAWIEAAIRELGYLQSGPVEQLRNWSISSILAAPTSAGRVYFKAAAALPLFVNEPALTQTLAELEGGHVPTPLKIDRDKRWLLMKDFGPPAWDDDDIDLAPILAAYGKLQRASAEHLDKLAAAGCIDRRLAVLANQIDWLLTDPTTQRAITPPEFDELVALAPLLKERCAQVAAYNLPATLLHGDLHLGNITRRNGDYIFFDWTDAAIGFPFLDFFLLYQRKEQDEKSLRWRDAYLEVWQEYESPARLREVWELAKPLCALHHSISYLSIVNSIEPLTRNELAHGLTDNLQHLLTAMRA